MTLTKQIETSSHIQPQYKLSYLLVNETNEKLKI